jgi:hypothetical protein
MRNFRSGLFVLWFVSLVPASVLGQTPVVTAAPAATQGDQVAPPSWLFNDIACAAGLTTQLPPALRVIGSQDPTIKHMLGPGDTLVISGGTAAGLQPGQQFFVRRNVKTFGAKGPDPTHPITVHTAGWIQILGVDASVATATVVHACEGMMLDDYLEPFTAPAIAARRTPGTLPQYSNMGRIAFGDENMQNVATGQMIRIDRGTNAGVVLGQRFLVFRDKRSARNGGKDYSMTYVQNAQKLPLVEVAEVLVIAVRPDDATVQVTVAKDTVMTGDFIAEIR